MHTFLNLKESFEKGSVKVALSVPEGAWENFETTEAIMSPDKEEVGGWWWSK